MPRPQSPFVIQRRKDSKTFIVTINPTSGLRLGYVRNGTERVSRIYLLNLLSII
jgi:hypothetical protein